MQTAVAIVRVAICYFLIVFGAGFLLALVRIPYLVPRVGACAAELIEMPVMLLVIVFAAGYVVPQIAAELTQGFLLAAGFLALLLMVVVECLLAYVISGHSPAAYIASRHPVSGSVYLVMLMGFALMPWLMAYMRSGGLLG